ncbi:MAG: biosynthetic-type acetolactate synthase large subunit [bacterium]
MNTSNRTSKVMTGAQALLEGLQMEGVDIVFGYPGGQALPIYDALYDSPIRHILVRHEQGAAHMADAYSRTTGKTGVCIATSGPGATNLVTGIATAFMDSIPMIAITGQVPTNSIGKDAFQEADITGITMPITKHNYLVKDANDLPRIIREAFYIASTGRPGPVLIDLPRDVAIAKITVDWDKVEMDLHGYRPTVKGNTKMIRRALEMLSTAKRPVLYVGGGIIRANAAEALTLFARAMQIPVTATLMGKGAFPELDDLYMGTPGMHGTAYANLAMDQADVIFCIGARFDDRVTGNVSKFAVNAKIIHADVDPAEIGKVKNADVPIVGDAKAVLEELLDELAKNDTPVADYSAWRATVNEWKEKYPLMWNLNCDRTCLQRPSLESCGSKRCGSTTCAGRQGILKAPMIIQELSRITENNAIVTTDVGQHQMWAMQYYLVKDSHQFASSAGLGTMGYGLPAAIGAQFGNPDREVWCITGDGSLQMNIQELATAFIHKLPIKIMLLNNGTLGMVRQWQTMFYEQRYSQIGLKVGTPDFVKLAEAYGCVGIRVVDPAGIHEAIDQARQINDRPVLIEFLCDMDEKVFPMIPAGQSVAEMIIKEKEEACDDK